MGLAKVKQHGRAAKDVWEGTLSGEQQGTEGTRSHASNARMGPAEQC